MKREKMGSDPLAWIKDSKQDNSSVSTLPKIPENVSKPDQLEKQSNLSKHSNSSQQDNTVQPENLSIQNVQSLSVTPNKQSPPENIDKVGLPSKPEKPLKSKGLNDGWTRATFIMREENLDKLKDLAYWERLQIKEVMDNILTDYFSRKVVQQRPDGR